MLSWSLAFFIVAMISAVFGFGGVAAASEGVARVLFFLFLLSFVVTFLMGLAEKRKPGDPF